MTYRYRCCEGCRHCRACDKHGAHAACRKWRIYHKTVEALLAMSESLYKMAASLY